MSEAAAPAAIVRRVLVRTPAAARQRRWRITASLTSLSVLVSVIVSLLLKADDRALAAPMFAIAVITFAFVMILWARDGAPPVFETGTLCVLATAVYGALSMAGLFMMHGQWDRFSDSRLQAYPFIPGELGLFGWRYAVYLASFVVIYLLVRGGAAVKTRAFTMPSPNAQASIVVLLIILLGCKLWLRIVFDYPPVEGADAYSDPTAAAARATLAPYLVQQVGHNILSALFLVELAVILLLLAHWRLRWCRYVLIVSLGAEVVLTAVRLGSRSEAVLLLLSAGMLFHRLVKRLSLVALTAAGTLLLSAFLVHGAIRGVQSSTAAAERLQNVLTTDNEFQALFTTAFDIHKRKEAGQIGVVPRQMYVSDFILPIPSQLLPFKKFDPATWYLELIGAANTGVGFMFGVMAQAAVGFDWIELVVRGAVLALFLALLHRWYVRRALRFWPTLFYLFVSIWTYYTFRASSFYFLYFLLYHFVPVLIAAKLLEALLRRVRRRAAPA